MAAIVHEVRLLLSLSWRQVYAILDEYVLAGEVQETSKLQILSRIRDMEKLE